MGTPHSAWGIDIGDSSLKALKLVRHAGQLKVEEFELVEHEQCLSAAEDRRGQIIRSSLEAFLDRHSLRGSAVALGLSGMAGLCRFVALPPVERAKLPEIIKFEAVQQIPFPLDQVEWSHQLLPRDGSPTADAGIFAVRREVLEQHARYLAEQGVAPVFVQLDPVATYNALHHERHLGDTPTLILDVGADHTDLLISHGSQIWTRSFPLGGRALTEALGAKMKLGAPEAEAVKRRVGEMKHAQAALRAMQPAFAALADELQRTLGFYAPTHPDSHVRRLVPLGGGLLVPGLVKYLTQRLQVELAPVEKLSAGAPEEATLATAFAHQVPVMMTAYGLALQAMGHARITASLVPKRTHRAMVWRRWSKTLIVLVALAAVGGLGSFLYHRFLAR